jgi:hypothetical protein
LSGHRDREAVQPSIFAFRRIDFTGARPSRISAREEEAASGFRPSRFGQKIGLRVDSLLALENSLFFENNSLLCLQKFPVPLRREFGSKPLNSLAD